MSENTMSVENRIKAYALLNIEDIFRFTLTAKDADIKERYGSEREALEVAAQYLHIALSAKHLNESLGGWSMEYTQPIKNSNESLTKKAYFYDRKEDGAKITSEKPPCDDT